MMFPGSLQIIAFSIGTVIVLWILSRFLGEDIEEWEEVITEDKVQAPEEGESGVGYVVSVICQNCGNLERVKLVRGYGAQEALELGDKYCSRCHSTRLKAVY